MKSETEKQLKAILENKQKQNQEAERNAANRKNVEANNTRDFQILKESVIKPAFQEIVNLFQQKQSSIWITEEDEQQNRQGGKTPAAIGLEIFERHPLSGNMTPEFKFLYYNGSRKLLLWTSTRSQGGPVKDVAFENVTADWIQEKFTEYAKNL